MRMLRAHLRRLFRRTPGIVRRVRDEALTYLSQGALTDLHDAVTAIERRGVRGSIIEAGCALGGSAIVLATAKAPERPCFVYDVFGMIPEPSSRDGEDVHRRYAEIKSGRSAGIGGGKYYGYEDDLLGKVTENFHRNGVPIDRHNVRLVRGLFQDTLHPDGPVALAHIDGDWYESVTTCLARIDPYLVPGGSFVLDDYDAWSGCRAAVDEYFADKRDRYRYVRRARLHVVRS